MTEKRNIHALIEKEAPSLNNLLDPQDVKAFKEMTAELRDTWTKKQVFRTETEMRMSVLNTCFLSRNSNLCRNSSI